MKTIRIFAAAAAAMLLLAGCQKSFLDKESRSALPGEWVVTTEDGLDLLLTGAYNGLQNRNYYGGVLYLYEATKGPDFFQRVASGGYSFAAENQYSGGKSQSGNCPNAWTQIYNVIRNTTIILESIDDVAGDIGHLRHIKGEAYALQALAYFDLLRLYAYPPRFSCPWVPPITNSTNGASPSSIPSTRAPTSSITARTRTTTASSCTVPTASATSPKRNAR